MSEQPQQETQLQQETKLQEPSVLARVLGVLGFAFHLAVGIFYLSSGLMAPLYGIAFLWICWILFLAVAIKLWPRAPQLIVLVPLAAFLWWTAVMTAGERFLGWTA